jgi:hypothetical protein
MKRGMPQMDCAIVNNCTVYGVLTVLDETKDWEQQFVPFHGASRLLGSPIRVEVHMACGHNIILSEWP